MEEGPPPPELWESLFLKYPYNVIFHAILPTIFITLSGQMVPSEDERVNTAQKANLYCISCQKVCKKGTKVRVCVRIVIGRSDAKDVVTHEPAYIYRAGFGSALLCCGDEKKLPGLSSNTPMHEVLYQLFEVIFPNLGFENMHKKLNGDEIFNLLLLEVNKNHNELVHLTGKANNECGFCKKPNPPKRCAGCHYARYCNKTCADNEWNKIHKKECKAIKSVKFIFPKNMIKIKSQ